MTNETMDEFVEEWTTKIYGDPTPEGELAIRDLCNALTARHRATIEDKAYIYCEGRETYEDAHNEGVDAALRALEED